MNLCSVSNFDAYFVTRPSKAPKPFVFAIKSTDNLSFFENTADYMHTFACETRDGLALIEKILLARVSGYFTLLHISNGSHSHVSFLSLTFSTRNATSSQTPPSRLQSPVAEVHHCHVLGPAKVNDLLSLS